MTPSCATSSEEYEIRDSIMDFKIKVKFPESELHKIESQYLPTLESIFQNKRSISQNKRIFCNIRECFPK